jgi:hypothetical protein
MKLYIIKKMLEQQSFNENIRILCNRPKTDKYIKPYLMNSNPEDTKV